MNLIRRPIYERFPSLANSVFLDAYSCIPRLLPDECFIVCSYRGKNRFCYVKKRIKNDNNKILVFELNRIKQIRFRTVFPLTGYYVKYSPRLSMNYLSYPEYVNMERDDVFFKTFFIDKISKARIVNLNLKKIYRELDKKKGMELVENLLLNLPKFRGKYNNRRIIKLIGND